MLIFIIGLIVWGFIVGALARLSLPGPDPMPWYATIGLGLGGSIIGGILARPVPRRAACPSAVSHSCYLPRHSRNAIGGLLDGS